MIIKKPSNLIFVTSLFFFVAYVIEFIFLNADASYFWCISTNYFESINAILPIHCDEGPYRQASESFDFFFSENNPYQKRPIYVILISFLRQLINFLSFGLLSNYVEFRVSMVILQLMILFFIGFNAVKLFNLEKLDLENLLILFTIFSIPNVRWNLLFPSHGNLTLLLLIYTLRKLENINYLDDDYTYFSIIGLGALLHRSAIIYAIIFIVIKLFVKKIFSLKNIFFNLLLIILPTAIYELSIYFSRYQSFDWNREIYGQFYWIIDIILGRETSYHDMSCQQLSTFINCNLNVTKYFVQYFTIGIIFLTILIFINLNVFQDIFFKNLILFTFTIYIFWALQGLYPNFRFVNYSLGYFLFLGLIYLNYKYYKSKFFSLSILVYEFSIFYLEPYSVLTLKLNYLSFVSIVLFIAFFIYVLNPKIRKDNRYV